MPERFEDYARTYRSKLEDELDRVAQEMDQLESDAQAALISELKARGRTDAEISALVAKGKNLKQPLGSIEDADAVLANWVGNVRRVNGTGRILLGQTNCEHNDEYGYDELDTTLWWTFLHVPFLPRGSFRIRRRTANPDAPRFVRGDSQFVMIRRLPFLWANNVAWLLLALTLLWGPLAFALLTLLRGYL